MALHAFILSEPVISLTRATEDNGSPAKPSSNGAMITSAAVDVKEDKDHFLFMVDVPGLKKDDVKVQLEDATRGRVVLSITGERRRETKSASASYHRAERLFGRFHRRFGLPETADVHKISARCEEGVLTVTVPKRPRQEEKKREPTVIAVQ
eukprot:TRINITY_DN23613_c0_g1_i1.p2 TRINITY_DN23613_c0_g1~~TRINITY_DN23613_c0_g1_i1.p2  ORF type:complete len:152 (+),score=20.65 TRINITY_DN23613_c0_g1_i1:153-608(+)